MISIVTPAYNEADNLPALYSRLSTTMTTLGLEWEWVVVDDHSRDRTFDVLRDLAARDARVRGLRCARNVGSHAAIACGLHHAAGDAAIMLAGDLQDPPETIGAIVERWRHGAQVVWAVRRSRPGDRSHAGFASVYYWIMRRIVGLSEMPARGADFFLASRDVLEALRTFPERPTSIFALLTWIGFRQECVEYDKQPRAAGTSGWTLARKIQLVSDSITAFSGAPIRWCGGTGLVLLIAGIGVTAAALAGGRGLGAVVGAIVAIGGVQLLAIGIVGEYVARTLAEAQRRPAYVIEATTSAVAPVTPGSGPHA